MIHIEALTQAVLALLNAGNTTGSRVDVFDGTPVAVMDSDGLAHPYITLYPTPGTADRMPYAPTADGLLWSFQTTCVGGDPIRARRAVDRCRDRLDGQRLTVTGVQAGVLRAPEFTTPGPLREDRDVSPSRWFAPLQWELYAVPA